MRQDVLGHRTNKSKAYVLKHPRTTWSAKWRDLRPRIDEASTAEQNNSAFYIYKRLWAMTLNGCKQKALALFFRFFYCRQRWRISWCSIWDIRLYNFRWKQRFQIFFIKSNKYVWNQTADISFTVLKHKVNDATSYWSYCYILELH